MTNTAPSCGSLTPTSKDERTPMDSETASSLIYGMCAEIAAGNGTATAKLGDVHDVEPPEGWTPLSEAAAFIVTHQVVRRLWTNARPLADVAVDVALRVYHREVVVNRESANRCKALGYSADAGCHLRSLRRHVAVTRCLSAYPAAWEHVRQLLVDDDAETWEARAAAVADAHYPGWRDMPFVRERCGRPDPNRVFRHGIRDGGKVPPEDESEGVEDGDGEDE